MATAQSSADFSQRSLATLWRDPASRSNWPAPEAELAQLRVCACFPNYTESFRSVTQGDWHYIVGSKGEEQLFHVSTDPTNLNNVIGSAPPQVLDQLRQSLASANW